MSLYAPDVADVNEMRGSSSVHEPPGGEPPVYVSLEDDGGSPFPQDVLMQQAVDERREAEAKRAKVVELLTHLVPSVLQADDGVMAASRLIVLANLAGMDRKEAGDLVNALVQRSVGRVGEAA